MIRYKKEFIILLLQLFMFYIFPLFTGSTDAMGMVFLIWLSTIIISISKEKIKYLHLITISILFIYYNESALIHSLWYLISSGIGILIGKVIYIIKKNIIIN